jgi:hypothetical protein
VTGVYAPQRRLQRFHESTFPRRLHLVVSVIPRHRLALLGLFILPAAPVCVSADSTPAAASAFDAYVSTVESRLAQQHRSPSTFLTPLPTAPQSEARLRRGELIVDNLTPSPPHDSFGAMLHHWRGTAFVPGATAADFLRVTQNFSAYPKYFAPQILQAKVLAQQGDRLQASMRVRQHHLVTVVFDITADIAYGRLDPQRQYSFARSTKISEIDAPGTAKEHALSSGEDHGYLWRLNTYWSFEERDGGLYMQIESVSLTRSVPPGLGWLIGPFVESVPRDSLEFTLRSTCNALHK